ncbi:MAG: hypothetical protein DHS20C18_43880 [Saprospiraceae bacterium]|nr:MAG: hypothetical protein DHS20C18_43880 [Saprospiraceae bacterium]
MQLNLQTRIQTVINWIGNVEGLNLNRDQLWWLFDNTTPTQKLIEGYNNGDFSDEDCSELIKSMTSAHSKQEWEVNEPRAEYIDQIETIRVYLEHRHSDYGEAAQYLSAILPLLIDADEFTNE